MKRSAIFTVLFAALLSVAAHAGDLVRVTGLEAGVYDAPGGSSLDIRVHRGSVMHYVDESRGWLRVQLRNGVQGWVPGWSAVRFSQDRLLPPIPGPEFLNPSLDAPAFATVFSDFALLRSDPTNTLPAASDRTRLGMLPRGVRLKLVGRQGNWFRVELSRAFHAWVYGELLDFSPGAGFGADARLRSAALLPDKRRHTLQVSLDRKAPFRLFSTDRGVELYIYGAAAAGPLPARSGPFTVRQAWPDVLVVECALRHAPLGFSAQYLDVPLLTGGATLLFQVNRARAPHHTDRGPLSGWRIALDPGHGAATPPLGYAAGTSTSDGLAEHEVNLAVALSAARYLEDFGAEVILTRTDRTDAMNDLYARTDLAIERKADVFVSIHANGGPPSASGLEVYHFEPHSQALAAALTRQLEARINTGPGQTRFASFAVLRQTQFPSALVELGYMTNAREARLFRDPAFLDNCARGIAEGVAAYIAQFSAPGHPAY